MDATQENVESLQRQVLEAQETSRRMVLRALDAEAERDRLAACLMECRHLLVISGISTERFNKAMIASYDALEGERRRRAGVKGRG